MKASRRQVLAAAATAGVLTMPRMAWALGPGKPLAVIADPLVGAGRSAAAIARAQGLPLSTRGNDIAGLLYGNALGWLADGRTLMGVTGWSGMVVAQGIAREQGRGFRVIDAQEAQSLLPGVPAAPAFYWLIG